MDASIASVLYCLGVDIYIAIYIQFNGSEEFDSTHVYKLDDHNSIVKRAHPQHSSSPLCGQDQGNSLSNTCSRQYDSVRRSRLPRRCDLPGTHFLGRPRGNNKRLKHKRKNQGWVVGERFRFDSEMFLRNDAG